VVPPEHRTEFSEGQAQCAKELAVLLEAIDRGELGGET
jgi:hypothetical protein